MATGSKLISSKSRISTVKVSVVQFFYIFTSGNAIMATLLERQFLANVPKQNLTGKNRSEV